ncbi:MAG: phosphoglycolate phosphatase [Gemmobacter sp.]|nr:phosphoglycolate phosphatase [Gemmobacter sp.]
MWRALIFDLDGTLVDSAPDIVAAGNAVLLAEGLPPVPFAQARGFIGNGAPVFVSRMERAASGDSRPDRTARMIRRFVTRYEHGASLTRPYPGVAAALSAFAATGLPLALCTNKPEAPARALLASLGWADLFAVVVGGDTLPVVKPDPAPLHAALTGLGLAPHQALFLGDSDVDAETATRAGVAFALFTGGYRTAAAADLPHRLAFDDWSALPGLLAASL